MIVVLGLVASMLLIGNVASSKIGLTDENDLPQYVGTSGHIAFSDIPRLLVAKTDLGQFGQSQRFRPFYYVARLTETALWGLDGSSWYRARIVMFGMVIAAMFWIFTQCVGLILGAALTAYTLSFRMWVDIWTRSTGPSEQYASVGTALYAVGVWLFIERWRKGKDLLAPSIAMAAGAVIAMGSKENMLLLEVPLLAALSIGLWQRKLDWVSALALTVAIAFGIWIASSIVVFFLGAKVQDIYGNGLRMSLLTTRGMVIVYVAAAITAVSVLTIIFLLRGDANKDRRMRYLMMARQKLVYAAVILSVFMFNMIFYTGQLPTGIRYDFPALLCLPALAILLLRSLRDTASLFGFERATDRAVGAVMCVAMLIIAGRALPALPTAAAANTARNSAFDAGLQSAQRLAREHPQWPIFVKSFNYLDYEVIQALGFFFIAKGISNPRYLVYVDNPYHEPRSAFQSELEGALVSQSSNGIPDRGYLPLSQITQEAPGHCFVVVLRAADELAKDSVAGKDPKVGQDCVSMPPRIYWRDRTLVFEHPGS